LRSRSISFQWLVIDAVEQLDLAGFAAGYRLGGAGRQAYDPAMLLGLLLYGYAMGERSAPARAGL
jgi:transposase